MKSIFKKYKSPENGVFVPTKVNLELWKLLRRVFGKEKVI